MILYMKFIIGFVTHPLRLVVKNEINISAEHAPVSVAFEGLRLATVDHDWSEIYKPVALPNDDPVGLRQ
jgi:hypothetical protein